MNLKKIEKLVRHLREMQEARSAARFNMEFFGERYDEEFTDSALEEPICKTQACLAGETVLMDKAANLEPNGGIRMLRGRNIEATAGRILGLTNSQRQKLFFFTSWGYRRGWPVQFQQAYDSSETPQERLQVAIERVKHFIRTKGRE